MAITLTLPGMLRIVLSIALAAALFAAGIASPPPASAQALSSDGERLVQRLSSVLDLVGASYTPADLEGVASAVYGPSGAYLQFSPRPTHPDDELYSERSPASPPPADDLENSETSSEPGTGTSSNSTEGADAGSSPTTSPPAEDPTAPTRPEIFAAPNQDPGRKADVDERWAELTEQNSGMDDDPGPSIPPLEYKAQVNSSFSSPANTGQLGDRPSGGGAGPVATLLGNLVCPVADEVRFIDDWGFPRSGGRVHRGNDMFAPTGTPLVAVADGQVLRADSVDTYRVGSGRGDLGGITIWMVSDAGDAFYYAHMSGLAPGITKGARVAQGQLVGWVGNSGNAATTPPHLHFGVYPGSGSPVNPYPFNAATCDRP